MRSNLIFFVFVLVNQNFIGPRDEYEDDDEVRTLQQRVEVHENGIGFHVVSYEVLVFSASIP